MLASLLRIILLTATLKILERGLDKGPIIDEIESGLYYRMFSELLFVFYDMALELNCQLFIITQSWEVLSETACMLEEMGQLKKLAYVRLERDNMIRAKQFQGKELLAAAESDLELR